MNDAPRDAAPVRGELPRVSVVITFLNAERFLDEAVRSVFAQTFTDWELILVDDGSSDRSTEIAHRCRDTAPDSVRCVEHEGHANRGISASRNLGIRHGRGELVALLDADDIWLPEKLREQVAILDAHPEVGMVYGRPLYWSSWRDDPDAAQDHIAWTRLPLDEPIPSPLPLLRSYPLSPGGGAPCPSDLLFRRSAAEDVGLFEASFDGIYQLYEDQAFLAKFYLRHDTFVADDCWTWYRLHPDSVMARVRQAGKYAVVRAYYLEWLESYLRDNRIEDRRVWRAVRAAAKYRIDSAEPDGRRTPAGLLQRASGVARRQENRAIRTARTVARVTARVVPGRRHEPDDGAGFTPDQGEVDFGDLRRTSPISRHWGWNRGQPVDRYYVERFLSAHANDIRGRVLEVGDRRYTRRFGLARVRRSDVLHVDPDDPRATIIADLENADHVPSGSFDCIILTQTLHLVWDVHRAARTLHRIIAPGGVLLLTVPGITQTTDDNWRDRWYWSFNAPSLTRLADETFGPACRTVETQGNVLAATAFLHGLARQELSEAELDAVDPDFPVTLTLRAWKEGSTAGDSDPGSAADGSV